MIRTNNLDRQPALFLNKYPPYLELVQTVKLEICVPNGIRIRNLGG